MKGNTGKNRMFFNNPGGLQSDASSPIKNTDAELKGHVIEASFDVVAQKVLEDAHNVLMSNDMLLINEINNISKMSNMQKRLNEYRASVN